MFSNQQHFIDKKNYNGIDLNILHKQKFNKILTERYLTLKWEKNHIKCPNKKFFQTMK